MVYKFNVTDHADELLDNLVYHLIYRLKNKQAATHMLECIDVRDDVVNVVGIFHQLENYQNKL